MNLHLVKLVCSLDPFRVFWGRILNCPPVIPEDLSEGAEDPAGGGGEGWPHKLGVVLLREKNSLRKNSHIWDECGLNGKTQCAGETKELGRTGRNHLLSSPTYP